MQNDQNKKDAATAPLNEPGMHQMWLVEDPVAFFRAPGHASARDQLLPFGVTHEEWYALFFEVLKVAGENPSPRVSEGRMVGGLPAPIPEFPTLSKIRGHLVDAIYRPPEVALLRQECRRVQELTDNIFALRGVNKLLHACALAEETNRSVYLLCD